MPNKEIQLNYNPKNGDYQIIHHGFSWKSDGRRPFLILRKKIGKRNISVYRSLYSAKNIKWTKEEKKITTVFRDYFAFGKKLDFTIIVQAEIIDANTVVFSLKAENETAFDIQAVYFPAPLNSEKAGKISYHVDTMRQGFLMPDGYKKNLPSTLAYTHYIRKINTGDCYLPFWGRVCEKNGFTAIVETPYDASIFSCFGKRSSFLSSVYWDSSLGKLSYERKIRFIFHEKMDYNTCAKDYRTYLLERNQLLLIDEKIKQNQNIKKLIGCPVLHHKIYAQIQPESQFYEKNGVNQLLYASFEQRAEEFRKLKKLGLEKLYIHTDGWGENGYDNCHPYILPPCKEAGGWKGLQTLADTCDELGYIFALHDQYRDFYTNSPVYDEEKAVTNLDGSHPSCSIWDGGKHSFLCATQALPFIKKTYDELDSHKIKVQGVYLDVFSVVNGDECFHPNHPVTREESIKHRAACFDYLNRKGLIMSSEEPAMQLVNHFALVHHGPYALRPQVNGEPVGIPVPLADLVLHDCVMIPWNWWNHWGIPKGEDGNLYCALHAGIPYFHAYSSKNMKIGKDLRSADKELLPDEKLLEEIHRIRPLLHLQAKLYNKEMLRHEFIDGRRKQKTVFSDGTTVTVDFEKGIFEVKNEF